MAVVFAMMAENVVVGVSPLLYEKVIARVLGAHPLFVGQTTAGARDSSHLLWDKVT